MKDKYIKWIFIIAILALLTSILNLIVAFIK